MFCCDSTSVLSCAGSLLRPFAESAVCPSDTSETVQYDYLDAHVDQPTSSTIRSGYSIGYGTVRHRTSSPTDHLLTCVGELPIPQPHRSPLSRPPPSKTATKAKPITTKADTRTSRHPHRPHPPPPWKPNEPIASPVSQAWNEWRLLEPAASLAAVVVLAAAAASASPRRAHPQSASPRRRPSISRAISTAIRS